MEFCDKSRKNEWNFVNLILRNLIFQGFDSIMIIGEKYGIVKKKN